MIWHVVFAEAEELPRSQAARSRDAAIHTACELLARGCDVRRIIEPDGRFISRAELDEHYDEGRFPGLAHAPANVRETAVRLSRVRAARSARGRSLADLLRHSPLPPG